MTENAKEVSTDQQFAPSAEGNGQSLAQTKRQAGRRTEKAKRKPQKRGVEIRQKIVQTALELFGEHGFEGTSMRSVADRLDITHTRVLYHFKSKDDLWIATLDAALSRYFSAVRKNLLDEEKPAAEGLKIFVEQFVRMSAQVPQIHRIMTMEGNQDTERLSWLIENYLRDHFSQLKALIMRGQAEGTVRDCDPARLYYFLLGAAGTPYTLSTEYRALTGRDIFSEQEILRNIAFLYDLIFVSNPPGR